MNDITPIMAAIGAFFLGSIPFGYLIAKTSGMDIRTKGSGNIGATNVWRQLGLAKGVAVGILDFAKSYLVALLVMFIWHPTTPIAFAVILMPVIGHIFTPWLKFRGGKGVSTVFGMLAGVFGWQFFLAWIAIWLVALKLTKLMSLVNLLMALAIPILFFLKFHSFFAACFGLTVAAIIWITHRTNINRLVHGTESKLHI